MIIFAFCEKETGARSERVFCPGSPLVIAGIACTRVLFHSPCSFHSFLYKLLNMNEESSLEGIFLKASLGIRSLLVSRHIRMISMSIYKFSIV